MMTLYSMGPGDAALLRGSPYGDMEPEAMGQMLQASVQKVYCGSYFELLAVMDGACCVGFVNMSDRGSGTISCAPDIKPQFRRQGFGTAAMMQALEYAKMLGYTRAAAQVRRDNAASIALHRKLGFSLASELINGKGHPVFAFEKPLENG